MKNQSTFAEVIIGGAIAFFTLTIYMLCAHAVKPVALFGGRLLWKGVQKGSRATLAKLTTRKAKPAPAELPTPDIFKGMSNLAPAKQIRF